MRQPLKTSFEDFYSLFHVTTKSFLNLFWKQWGIAAVQWLHGAAHLLFPCFTWGHVYAAGKTLNGLLELVS